MNTVSVILATYNGQKYIIEQLDSILNQTRVPDEVIIGDDKSTDDTASVVKKYLDDHRINGTWNLIVNEKNKGYANNYLDLALMATGKYIFFCDQDDIWDSEKIAKMSQIMDGNDDIKLLCSNLEPFYDGKGGRKWDQSDLDAMTNDGSIEMPEFNYFNFFCQRSGCTMCVRRECVNILSMYWTDGWAHDDFFWKMTILEGNCAIYQYCSIKRRMHENNASSIKVRTRDWRIKQVKQQLEQYVSFLKFANEHNVGREKIEIIERNIKCAKCRISLLEIRNPLQWVAILLKYRSCYPRMQALILDLYLTIFSQYKGVN